MTAIEESSSGTAEEAVPAGARTGPQAETAPDPETTPWSGPGAWVFPGVTATVGGTALWGSAALTVADPVFPGPGFFPGAVGALLLALTAVMTVQNIRTARGGAAPRAATEWPPVLVIAVSLAAFVALLEVLGWLLAGALLFWGVAHGFGARRHLRDAAVALSASSAVQVGFSMGLGLPLPGGIVEWVF